MGPDDGQDVDARRVGVSEDFDHAPLGTLGAVAPVLDRHHDLLAFLGLLQVLLGDVDVEAEARVVWDDEAESLPALQRADDLRVRALEDLDDPSLRIVASASALDPGDHAVTMDGTPQLVGRHEDVGVARLLLLRHDESRPPARGVELPTIRLICSGKA